MPITHIGKTMFVPHHSSRQVELQNVYHVPGISKLKSYKCTNHGKEKIRITLRHVS
ncbi:hypothetical protein KY290_022301 [Solanum tuberosum]|uniref:Uncharacterized protein n=1 Tax=Solanum tuberosum TaxID=4113 RepID=A0ABQ7V405_SOLTU|nr:hypothetical protein KY289_021429 [Solanum tuberosum]KAH0758808.1 hypothetical protein KY290_022301 [Solanum tuberosum]